MANSSSSKPRVLADLSNEALLQLLKDRGLAPTGKDTTPVCEKVMHTPKKGRDMGKSVPRLRIAGNNLYPFLLSAPQCELLAMFSKEIAAYAKSGK